MSESGGLSHVDARGRAAMVDVTAKSPTLRVARAHCTVRTSSAGLRLLGDETTGDVIVSTARTAGLLGAKRAASFIPLCHPIHVDAIVVDVTVGEAGVGVSATAEAVERTGVEMEALTACACAGMSILCAVWSVDPAARLDDLVLLHKSGGRSGTWDRQAAAGPVTGEASPGVARGDA
ncbi:MAG: cyclic pyranopterin monophosphate synthase MoaC [Acidimicrobiales bacterium]|jgi:cyclic pyranopterin phosphate synthase